MKVRGWIPAALLLVSCAPALAAPVIKHTPPTPVTGPAKPLPYVDPKMLPLTNGYLPDSMTLATVEQRTIRVRRFLDAFYATYMDYRPAPDSAGKVQFLKTMTDKEVLGLVAAKVNRPLDFEDRVKIRENTQRVLANVLFQRMVADSVTVTEAEAQKVYAQYQYQIHARHILFTDRATADRVRKELIAGRLKFSAAVKKYSIAEDREQDGDMGWAYRLTMDPMLAEQVYDLKPGELSGVIRDLKGYHVVQIIERKPMDPPAYNAVRRAIEGSIYQYKTNRRAAVLQEQGRQMIAMTYDTTNVRYASSQFGHAQKMTQDAGGPVIEINTAVPEFSRADTALVLARYKGGTYSLGRFMHSYTELSPVTRPAVNDFEAFLSQLDAQVLEPQMAEIARQKGLDKDPMAIEFMANKLEEIQVGHLFSDSVESRVSVTSADRKKYYEDHKREFVSFAVVRYAQFVRPNKASIDSVVAKLQSGARADDLVRADSLAGNSANSVIQVRNSGDHGTSYYKVLFEELKPGQIALDGPDKTGQYQVLQVLEHQPGRDLPYEEVEAIVDESVHNLKAEQALKEFIARHRRDYKINERFELLPYVLMSDPLDRR